MKKKILTALFVVISLLLLIVTYNFVTHLMVFKNHTEYFKKPIDEQVIMDWMSINYIERTYNIDLEEIYGNKIGIWRRNKTLGDYCEKYELNCAEFIITLEQYTNGN